MILLPFFQALVAVSFPPAHHISVRTLATTRLAAHRAFPAKLCAEASDALPPFAKLHEWDGNLPEFGAGVTAMGEGRYTDAVGAFTRAVVATPRGMRSRLGGQYALWLAQALQAGGQDAQALALLQRCEEHDDGDVSTTAAMLLEVANAPQLLSLGRDELAVEIQPFESRDRWDADAEVDYTALLSARRRTALQPRVPQPDTYSVEWFELQAAANQPSEPIQDETTQQPWPLLIASAVSLALGAGFIASYRAQ